MSAALGTLREEAQRYLAHTYPERLARALEVLPAGDLWWRPHPEALAVGTILVHLEGNVRQWILSGLGGAADGRRRSEEFRIGAGEGASAGELFARLRGTCAAAGDVIAGLSDARLAESVVVQGFQTTVLAAVLHVVEHFAWHTGQAVWIAKARAGPEHGIAYYDDAALDGAHNEPKAGS